ncbi:apontic [Holotrichia oblita]|uniref:Apontic n=1 Tax=Holotrichia oblita TaxID=644536 RepID=A0ACB9SYQ0_HOLOL|nr:apontic [Holotrichia oblita]
MSDKRSRSENWSNTEKNLLIEFIKDEIPVIENKKKMTIFNKDKTAAWERIARKLQIEGYTRDIKRIREQWLRMKISAKKTISIFKKQCYQTGGGPPPANPTDMDWYISKLVPQDFIEDVSIFDSDTTGNISADPFETIENNSTNTSTLPKKIIKEDRAENISTNLINDYSRKRTHSEMSATSTDCIAMDSETEEEIHIVIEKDPEPPSNTTTPSRKLKGCRSMKEKSISVYEEKLYELNRMRIQKVMQESREMHELKIQHEKEMHKLKIENEKEMHELRKRNERDYHAVRMKLLESIE